jgi:hypothetical protein
VAGSAITVPVSGSAGGDYTLSSSDAMLVETGDIAVTSVGQQISVQTSCQVEMLEDVSSPLSAPSNIWVTAHITARDSNGNETTINQPYAEIYAVQLLRPASVSGHQWSDVRSFALSLSFTPSYTSSWRFRLYMRIALNSGGGTNIWAGSRSITALYTKR